VSDKTKIYVCTRGKKCPKRGGEEVAAALTKAREALSEADQDKLSIKECKCLDLCKKGPAVMVMPDKIRYGRVEEADAREIVEAAVRGEEPVKRLVIKK
jgi:(2Fe-2S) ferredoxin